MGRGPPVAGRIPRTVHSCAADSWDHMSVRGRRWRSAARVRRRRPWAPPAWLCFCPSTPQVAAFPPVPRRPSAAGCAARARARLSRPHAIGRARLAEPDACEATAAGLGPWRHRARRRFTFFPPSYFSTLCALATGTGRGERVRHR
jgi:hypothetical protein